MNAVQEAVSGSLRVTIRPDYERTVLAHGCFDILHLGHIRHLQAALAMGDRLIVSISSDKQVNKGIGRPHFNEMQRAEALRALDCVDEVIISDDPHGAEALIKQLRPDIYVKGIDYLDNDSIGLAREKTAIEGVGGELRFTHTEKFSSSRIINAEKFSDEVLAYLENAKAKGFKGHILAAFERADKLKIAFVGEVIIDEYRYVQGLGRASKELMLATVETGVEIFEGGVLAAALHGEWRSAEHVYSSNQHIKKTRFVDLDFNRKLFDVYSSRQVEMTETVRKVFRAELQRHVSESDCVVVLDFGHGLIGPTERKIFNDAKFLAVNAQTNAGNYGFNLITKYHQADYICIDDPEARLATGRNDAPIKDVIDGIVAKIDCHKYVVTHGKNGSFSFDGVSGVYETAPAFTTNGIDTMGAGDAVMAVTAPLIAAGLSVEMAALVGNIAGAIKVSIVGHRRHVGRQEIVQTLEALLA